jgi:hypothetical protein
LFKGTPRAVPDKIEWEDQRKQLLETIDGTALKSAL